MSDDHLKNVTDIMSKHPVCMMTTQYSGALFSHPMTVLKVEDSAETWFFSSVGTSPVENINQHSSVNLCFAQKDTWLSVQGTAVIVNNEPKARDLWNPSLAAFYPDGPGSRDLVLIRVRPDSAQYWETSGGALATAFQWAKALAGGERLDPGESHTVEL